MVDVDVLARRLRDGRIAEPLEFHDEELVHAPLLRGLALRRMVIFNRSSPVVNRPSSGKGRIQNTLFTGLDLQCQKL